jgi:glycosyltransferase involved in cell wall biosynthesis
MHIGFDISQTGSGKAGCGYFAHAMLEAMLGLAPENRYTLLPTFGDFYFDAAMSVRSPYDGTNVHYGPRHLSRETAGSFWGRTDAEASLGHPDVVHSNNFWCPLRLGAGRLIDTFYDMGFVVEPEWTTETNRVGCFEGVFRSSLAADWIVAISDASRTHYLSIFPHFPESRIRVIHPCSRFADPTNAGKRPKAVHDIPAGGFWLNVGTVEPRKNQRRLADAYARYVADADAPMPLVLAGGKGWLMEDFAKHLDELGVAAHVLMTGYVTDDELVWLYRNCYANLYPSLFEGFGLPVLEGMQFGAATIASNSTSIPEVTGDAAILLPPEDVEAWAKAIARLAGDSHQRDALKNAALRQAATFDWKRSAGALLALYEEAAALPKRESIASRVECAV